MKSVALPVPEDQKCLQMTKTKLIHFAKEKQPQIIRKAGAGGDQDPKF